MAKNTDDNEEKDVLDKFYGAKAFVKIKQRLAIGKMLLTFVSLQDTKKHIDCYMEAEEFGGLLMADIKNGSLYKKLIAEKAKGDQYPKAVWTSPMGGNATGNNGKPISRYFTISPGNSKEVVLTAVSYPATQNDTGAFIPVKNANALNRFIIGISWNELRLLQYKWSFLENDYMSKKYCLANMQPNYNFSNESNNADKGASNTSQPDQASNKQKDDSHNKRNDNMTASSGKNYPIVELRTTTLLQPFGSKGHLCFKAIDRKNREYAVVIENSAIETFDPILWAHFKECAFKETGVQYKFELDNKSVSDRSLVKAICQ